MKLCTCLVPSFSGILTCRCSCIIITVSEVFSWCILLLRCSYSTPTSVRGGDDDGGIVEKGGITGIWGWFCSWQRRENDTFRTWQSVYTLLFLLCLPVEQQWGHQRFDHATTIGLGFCGRQRSVFNCCDCEQPRATVSPLTFVFRSNEGHSVARVRICHTFLTK